MRPGIEKEQILGILTDMVYKLEETDVILHGSVAGIRTDMCVAQSERIKDIGIVLDGLEKNLSAVQYCSTSLITDTKGLKLELGF